jgi:hypothetical protein
MVDWTIIFTIVLTAFFFINNSLKRTLQSKAMTTGDYLLWTSWKNDVQQFKGELTTHSRSEMSQHHYAGMREVKREDKNNPATIEYRTEVLNQEGTSSSYVREGDEVLLGLIDLNTIKR